MNVLVSLKDKQFIFRNEIFLQISQQEWDDQLVSFSGMIMQFYEANDEEYKKNENISVGISYFKNGLSHSLQRPNAMVFVNGIESRLSHEPSWFVDGSVVHKYTKHTLLYTGELEPGKLFSFIKSREYGLITNVRRFDNSQKYYRYLESGKKFFYFFLTEEKLDTDIYASETEKMYYYKFLHFFRNRHEG